MKQRLPFFTLFILLSTSFFGYSQNKPDHELLVFNHPGQELDFKNFEVCAITEDTTGFIWIGTSNGLYRYDGKSFKAFKHVQEDTNTFETNAVRSLLVTKNGTLWVGFDGAGIYKYDPIKEKFKHYQNPVNTISSGRVTWMGEDKRGRIWMATYGGGFNVFDPVTQLFTNYLHSDNDNSSILTSSPRLMDVTKDGKFWLGYFGYHGPVIDLFDPETKKVKRYNVPFKFTEGYGVSLAKQISDTEIVCLAEKELIFYNLKTGKCKIFENNEKDSTTIAPPKGLFLLKNGNILLKTRKGYDIFDRRHETVQHFIHNGDDPVSPNEGGGSYKTFFEDSKGNIWVANANASLEVIYPMPIKTKLITHKEGDDDDEILANAVFTFYESKNNNLWIGYYGAGVTVVDRKSHTTRHIRIGKDSETELDQGLVYDFLEDDNNIMWIATENGLFKFDIRNWKVLKKYFREDEEKGKPELVRTHRQANIVKGKDGVLWLGTLGGGLVEFNTRTEKYNIYRGTKDKLNDPNSLNDNRIMDMKWDPWNKLLWIGTYCGGVNTFDPATKKFTRFVYKNTDINSLSNNSAFEIGIDSTTGVLWVGTTGGLNAMNLRALKGDLQKVKFFHFTDDDGLADNNIGPIIFNGDGSMWVCTNSSTSYFTPPSYLGGKNNDELYPKGIIKIFKKQDGLPFEGGAGSAAIRSGLDNKIYIGGEGYYSFSPKDIIENKTPPKIILTEFKLFGQEKLFDTTLVSKKIIDLKYDENSISFSFAVLNFVFPEKNQLAYMLEGFDKKWTFCGNKNTAQYTNLDPGEYVFRVKGANNDSYWNNKGCSVRVIITPPFWRTKWFYTLSVLIIICSIYFFMKYREKKLQSEKKVLEVKVAERTSELKHQKELVEEKNKEITDSITYAKRLQNAILPSHELIEQYFPDSFVFYKPKDIVAGDFYWLEHFGDLVFIAAADCTGHGVPGAMVSVVCSNSLDRAVKEFGLRDTGKILDKTRELVIETFEKSGENVKDGMDISIFSINKTTKQLQWSGANNPLWFISKGELHEIKGDKQPIGKHDSATVFTTHTLEYKLDTIYYLITDGYADQFGGNKGKKFKYKQLQELFLVNYQRSMKEQEEILERTFEDWKANLEQIDDVTLIGIKI